MEDFSLITLTKTWVCPVPSFYAWLSFKKCVCQKSSQVGNSTSLDKGSQFLCTVSKRNLCFVGSACTLLCCWNRVIYFSVSFLFSLLRQKNRSWAGRWLTKGVEVLFVELVSPQGQRCCQDSLLHMVIVLPELEMEERAVCRWYSVFGIDFGEVLLKCVVTSHSEARCVVYSIVWRRTSLFCCGF